MKGVWKYAGMRLGALCVMIHGLILMQSWPADNQDSTQQVKYCSVTALNWYNLPLGYVAKYKTKTVSVGILPVCYSVTYTYSCFATASVGTDVIDYWAFILFFCALFLWQ